jgi:hypothetical protein
MSRSRRVRPTAVGIALLSMVAAACGSPTPAEQSVGGSSPAGRSESPSQPSPEESPASKVLAFTAPKLGGGQVTGRDFKDSDLAIWFWAPW